MDHFTTAARRSKNKNKKMLKPNFDVKRENVNEAIVLQFLNYF